MDANALFDVFRNDEISLDAVAQYDLIVLSPGPGVPAEAGIMPALIKRYAGEKAILGVCLGHQCIGQAFGAEVVRAERIMHGKTSMIYHRSQGVFNGLPQPFEALSHSSTQWRSGFFRFLGH